jgi:hypothetical protein
MASTYDISGSRIFGEGALGHAHARAHRHLDQGLHERGHRELGAWLERHEGSGSQWVHLQWHMLVFELAVGAWTDAHRRFLTHVLPAARSAEDAATDGPAALWRLSLSAPRRVELPWSEVHASAVARLDKPRDRYVELHDLLALAGAGDTACLDRWIQRHVVLTDADRVLGGFARALRAYAMRDYVASAEAFRAALPGLSSLGGSRAQNELFVDIYRAALARSVANDTAPLSRAG